MRPLFNFSFTISFCVHQCKTPLILNKANQMNTMETCPETSIGDKNSFIVDPVKIISDLLWLSEQSELYCMFECAQWANEQLSHLPTSHFNAIDSAHYEDNSENLPKKSPIVLFVRTLIINKDYYRAKYFLSKEKPTTCLEAFLYYFSWYMISIKNRLENDADDLDRKDDCNETNELSELRSDLEAFKISTPKLFGCFLNYILGLIRKKCGDLDMAIQAFTDAIHQDNRCWPAWEGLSSLIDGYYVFKIGKEPFSKTWFYRLFVADTMFRLQLYVCAIKEYTEVSQYTGSSPYILCQIAAAQSELQEHDSAINSFQKIRKIDPYRIEQMHFYSDSLYIRQNFVELSALAKWFYESHKFHWETCCIIANYYSAKNIHEQAQEFLKRAIRLCPTNASIWVLLGHEYLETKNNQAAEASYKKAAAIDPKCYRGWYGLGQLNEILKKHGNALSYYQKAHKCRPDDSRMLIALGVTFSKLDRRSDAEKCFKKAFQIGDVEGNALTHLAKLYDDQGDSLNAAKAYEAYLTLYTEELVGDLNLIATACRFLARYNLELGNLDTAYTHAQRCLNFDMSKEEGYRILRLIKSKRKENQEKGMGEQNENERNVSFRTPVDAPRPIGGGNSTLQTPVPQSNRIQLNLAENDEEGGGDDHETNEDGEMMMNTNSDDDLEISDDL